MVLWPTNQGPFVSPLPTDHKLHVQVQEAIARTKKKTGKGKDLPKGDSISVPPPKLQPRNQDGGFSNFGDRPGQLRENQEHYKNTVETSSNCQFKLLTVVYLLSMLLTCKWWQSQKKKRNVSFDIGNNNARFSDKRKLTQIPT